MAASQKPKVSAKEVLSDIRSGMTLSELKHKYGLSDKGAESLFRKLLAKGLVTEEELPKSLEPDSVQEELPREKNEKSVWRCPACGAPQDVQLAECPVCGVVAAKFLEPKTKRTEHIIVEKSAYTGIPKLRSLMVFAVTALVFLGLMLFLAQELQVKEKPKVTRIVKKAKIVVEKGKKIDLSYSPKGYPFGLSVYQGTGPFFFKTPDPNQGFKKTPPETGLTRYYGVLKIADRKFRILTEESNPPKIYLDANGDGDLTNDPGPFVGESPKVTPNHYPLKLPYKGEPENVPYRIWLFNSRMGGTGFYPKCHWHGKVVINNVSYKLILFDHNSDGDYSNDRLVIDVDNDGKAGEEEKLKPGQTCKVNGTDVKLISIAPSGWWARLDF
jgi:hypothetical protein